MPVLDRRSAALMALLAPFAAVAAASADAPLARASAPAPVVGARAIALLVVRRLAQGARYITSVCTGSLLLGAAGLLRGYRATSHWAARGVLAGFGAVPTDARVVRDRNRTTGAGVTAGLDLGLAVLAELRGDAYAELVQLGCEYDPRPPFPAGSPGTAPAAVTAEMTRLLSGFVAGAERVAAERPPGAAPT